MPRSSMARPGSDSWAASRKEDRSKVADIEGAREEGKRIFLPVFLVVVKGHVEGGVDRRPPDFVGYAFQDLWPWSLLYCHRLGLGFR